MKKKIDLWVHSNLAIKKLIMELKIVFLIIIASVSSVLGNPGYSQVAKVSLDIENKSLEQVIDEIERQSEFYFIFNQKQIDVNRVVDIEVENKLINDILPELFKGTNVNYAVFDRKILLTTDPLENNNLVIALEAESQQVTVRGTVSDARTGEALPGVNVVIQGTNTGTLTDVNGSYTLNIPNASVTLQFSFIGYVLQEISLNGRIVIDVVMDQSVIGLDEIVVVGYGTAKRKDLTGSIGSVNSRDLNEMTITSTDQGILGKVAGVQVKMNDGTPGKSAQIKIRGIGSISAGGEPLYVVDGFPVDNIQGLNPNDIENMDILKDASATAIYGSRGSNGVIIISTKRGTVGETKLEFGTYFGFQKVTHKPEMMNALQQAQYYYDGVVNRNLDEGNNMSGNPVTEWKRKVPQVCMDVLEGRNTLDEDALDAVLRTAPMSQYQLTASGGSKDVKFLLSGEYLNQDGIIVSTNFERFSLRSNIDAQLSKRLSVKINLNPSFTTRDIQKAQGDAASKTGGSVIANAIAVHNFIPLLTSTGDYFIFSGLLEQGDFYNPLASVREVKGNERSIQAIGNVNVDYKILNDLKFTILLGAKLSNSRGMSFQPYLPVFLNIPAFGSDQTRMQYNWLTETTLNYNKVFDKHHIEGLLGFTSQKDRFESNSLESDRFPNNLVHTLSAVSGNLTDGSSDVGEWSMLSYLSRLNYNYGDKYYLTASIRTDGSSRFGSDKKWGVFPSAAFAWRISEENFFKRILSTINDLKFRVSYGETGNNNIGNYEHLATISYIAYPIGGSALGGFGPARNANPSLTWETKQEFNMGLDVSLLKSRLRISADYFRSINKELLLNVNVPTITGFSTALKNIGEVQNTGWEFVISSVNVKNKFEWTTDFNISAYHNKVIKLGPEGDPIYSGGHVTMMGQPIGMFYGWVIDGIFMNQAELDEGPIFNPGAADRSRIGDIRYKDLTGPDGTPDGIIDASDRTIIGCPYPDFFYGMTNRFSYQNLSLSINLQGSQGNEILSLSKQSTSIGRSRYRQIAYDFGYWRSEQDPGNGVTPRPNDLPTGNNRGAYSRRYLEDGSYLRINSISLSYTLPQSIMAKLKLSSLRIYLNASNPFTFTKYSGFNPDVNEGSNPLTPCDDRNNYPLAKSLILGLNVTFF